MPPPTTRILLLAVYSLFIIPHSSLIAQHPSWQNFTTRDGLPSNEIFNMLQDSRGMLWFSTEQGLCFFNGYQFNRPVDTSATASGPSFKIVEDNRGRIWFQQLDATLWIVENDTVRAWEHNNVLDLYRHKAGHSEGFAVGRDGVVWLELTNLGFLMVAPNGTHQIAPPLNRTALTFSTVDGENVISVQQEDWKEAVTTEQFRRKGLAAVQEAQFRRKDLLAEIFRLQEGKVVSLGRFPFNWAQSEGSLGFRAWRLHDGDFILCHSKIFYLIHDNRLRWYGQKEVFAGELIEDIDGSILLTSYSGKHQGLLRFRSLEHFMRDDFDNLLPGKLATKILRDQEGGWWTCTRNAGVFYCKNPNLDIFDGTAGLPSEDVQAISTDGRATIFAGLRSLDIYVFHRGESQPRSLPRPPLAGPDFNILRFDTLTGRLWCSTPLCFWGNGRWTHIKSTKAGSVPATVQAKKITPDPLGTLWWASSSRGFFSIDRQSAVATRITPAPQHDKRTFSVTPDLEGNLWVTNPEGLRLWRNNRYEPPPFEHPALRFQAHNMALLPPGAGGGMVIALRGGGLLIRDKNGQCTQLTTHNGLTSDVLTNLLIAPDGSIYACSNAGLNIITPQSNGHWRIETLTVKHGLPSNQVNDVAQLGDEIWVATDHGIARFREKPAPAPMPSPQLERFRVNNRDTFFAENPRLAHDQNNISLRFFSLHFRSGGDIPYRYRLLGADTAFAYTHTREVSFVQLPPGKYSFEVQAQNEDGQWSEPAIWTFEIMPPWWATWWFRSLAGATLVVALTLFYQNRLRTIRQEASIRDKMRELQNAALRAQMNPHFIFNCLASIQHFIAENDAPAATRYLARFARLVRLALYGSLDGTHALSDEVEMLENYLALEQLRFRGKFKFDIRVDKELQSDMIQIPPMLVQPFIENAILHGMKNKVQDGKIEVVFSRINENLAVSIIDNGPGFNTPDHLPHTDAENGHKSVGIALTKNRLELLSEKSSESFFTQETLLTPEGTVAGLRVVLMLPLDINH